MLGSHHLVAEIEVVRPDADFHQTMDEITHCVGTVVDAAQEHRLIVDRDAGAQQTVAGSGGLRGDLVRMVKVGIDPDGVVLLQQRAHILVDALRQKDRNTRAEADDLDVRDGAKAGQDLLEIGQRQRQRIAAGDDNVADLGMVGDVLNHHLDAALTCRPVLVDPFPLARAVTAVKRAIRRDEKEAAVWIAMNDSGDRRVAFFVQRVPRQFAGIEQLFDRRHRLQAQRIVRIVEVDETEVVGGDGGAIELEDVAKPRRGHVIEGEESGQLRQ